MALADILNRIRQNAQRSQQFVPGANFPPPKFLQKPIEKYQTKLKASPAAKLIRGEGLKTAFGFEKSVLLGKGEKPTRQQVMDIAMSFGPGAVASIKKSIQPAVNVAKESVKEGLETLVAKKAIPTEINTRTFRVSEEGKRAINAEIDELRETIVGKTG